MLLIHAARVCLLDRAAANASLGSSAVRVMKMPLASRFGFDLGIIVGSGFSLGIRGSWTAAHCLPCYVWQTSGNTSTTSRQALGLLGASPSGERWRRKSRYRLTAFSRWFKRTSSLLHPQCFNPPGGMAGSLLAIHLRRSVSCL
jgi:hypothetical protein